MAYTEIPPASIGGIRAISIDPSFDTEDYWDFADGLARVQVPGPAATGSVVVTTNMDGGTLDLNVGAGNYALACPGNAGGTVPPTWVSNCKTDKWYIEARCKTSGSPSGTCRAALAGMWTAGGAALNAGSLINFGVSPADFTKYVLSMWDGAAWNETTSSQAVDLTNWHTYAIYNNGTNMFGYYDGAQIVSASVAGLGGSPTAGVAWTITAQNQANFHTYVDYVYVATVRQAT